MFSDEEKKKVLETLGEFYDNVDKYPSMQKACKEAGIKAIGKSVSYWSIRRWSEENEEFANLLGETLLARAEMYMEKCHKAVEEIQEFWEAPTLDSKGNVHMLTKERSSAVNKARLQMEHCQFRAAGYAPDVYGDYKHEIKKVIEEMKGMRAQLDAVINNRI